MELIDSITLFGILGVISTISLVLIFRLVPRKSPKRVMESELLRLQKAYSLTVDEVIARNQALNKSIQSENNRLRKELSAEPEEEDEQLDPAILSQIEKEIGIPKEQLALLAEMPQVKKMLGKNPNKTIMQYAPLLKNFIGKKNESQPTEQMY